MSFLDLCLPPIGPNLHRLSERKINLSGTSISIKVPDNNYWPEPKSEAEAQSYNLYDMELYRRKKLHKFEPEKNCVLARTWQYTRLLFSDWFVAKLEFAVYVVRMSEFQSLFRPRRLECAIERFIYATPNFSTQESGKNRLDWMLVDDGNLWVRHRYVEFENDRSGRGHVGEIWYLPITDEHLLVVRFRFFYHSKSELARKRCTELMGLVMKSFRVELSADALRQKAAMEVAYPYEKISPHLPPYEYETIEVLSEWDLARKVSEQLNHDYEFGSKRFEALFKAADLKQRQSSKDVRRRVFRSHLRFEELERQDYERYISSPPPEFKE